MKGSGWLTRPLRMALLPSMEPSGCRWKPQILKDRTENLQESQKFGNFPSTVCIFVLSAGRQCGITSAPTVAELPEEAKARGHHPQFSCWPAATFGEVASFFPSSLLLYEETRFSLCMICWEQHYINIRHWLLIRKLGSGVTLKKKKSCLLATQLLQLQRKN